MLLKKSSSTTFRNITFLSVFIIYKCTNATVPELARYVFSRTYQEGKDLLGGLIIQGYFFSQSTTSFDQDTTTIHKDVKYLLHLKTAIKGAVIPTNINSVFTTIGNSTVGEFNRGWMEVRK